MENQQITNNEYVFPFTEPGKMIISHLPQGVRNGEYNIQSFAQNNNIIEYNESNYLNLLNSFFELYFMENMLQMKLDDNTIKSLYGKLLNNQQNLIIFYEYFQNYLKRDVNGKYILTMEMYFFLYLKKYLIENINNIKIKNDKNFSEMYESLRIKVQILDFLPKISESKKMLIKYFTNEVNLIKQEFYIFQKALFANKFVLYIFKTNNLILNKIIYEYQNNLCRILNIVEENKNLSSIQLVFNINKDINNQLSYTAPVAFKNLPYLNSTIKINYFVPENNSLLTDFNIDIIENESLNILENFKSSKIIDFQQTNTYGILIPYYFSFSYAFMKTKIIVN